MSTNNIMTLPKSGLSGTFEELYEIMMEDPYGYARADWGYLYNNISDHPECVEDVFYYMMTTDPHCCGFGFCVKVDGAVKLVGFPTFCAMVDAYEKLRNSRSVVTFEEIIDSEDCDGEFGNPSNNIVYRMNDDKFVLVWYHDPIVIN